ncbi:hypothetical protein OCS_01504 [Ophiocordyceps sinensis CO18]|uniref:Uncharacterized protein n=1 Tax=Ophiocordyceps sinensis (strain Co18 / CGMCC 3.14243) TaxID=911162 RepID=T5ABG1_OPHSC|nr:hypothetical protein OCS_01504 [Ophiocordyceps sinensis CO18]
MAHFQHQRVTKSPVKMSGGITADGRWSRLLVRAPVAQDDLRSQFADCQRSLVSRVGRGAKEDRGYRSQRIAMDWSREAGFIEAEPDGGTRMLATALP